MYHCYYFNSNHHLAAIKTEKNRMYVPPRGNILLDHDAYMIPMTSRGNSNEEEEEEEEDKVYESVHSLAQVKKYVWFYF